MLQRMTRYTLEKPTISRNAYGEQIVSYTNNGYIDMLIAFGSNSHGEQNNVLIDNFSHIGLTTGAVAKGDRIGGKFEVLYVLNDSKYKRAFLREVEYA